jgi:hypothetical protein
MKTKQTETRAVKPAVVDRRRAQLEALQTAVRTGHQLIAEVRYAHSQACEWEPLLAMVLLGQLEKTVNLTRKLNEIASCVALTLAEGGR